MFKKIMITITYISLLTVHICYIWSVLHSLMNNKLVFDHAEVGTGTTKYEGSIGVSSYQQCTILSYIYMFVYICFNIAC